MRVFNVEIFDSRFNFISCGTVNNPEYALDYPDRLASVTRALDLTALSGLTFAKPDKEAFPMLELGYDILKYGQGYGAAVNAANETAVWRFIRGEIGFLDIYKTVKSVLDTLGDYLLNVNSLDKIYEIESEAAKIAGK